MGVFLAVVSKRGISVEEKMGRVLREEVLEQSIHFMHTARDVYFTKDKTGCLVNFASPTPVFLPKEKQFFQNEEGACALHGTIIEQKGEPADVPLLGAADLLRILSAGDEAWFREHYTGDFCTVALHENGSLTATCDALAFQHIFYSENEDFIYISNRIRCIRSVMERPRVNLEALATLCTIETVAGTDTVQENVRRLEINSRLCYSREGGLRQEGDPFYFAREIPGLDYRDYVEKNMMDCVNRLKSALRDVDDIEFALTGGRDSRANFALLLLAGQREKLRTYTSGLPNHPDVVVAKAISEHYGIAHRLQDRAAHDFTEDEILTRVMGTVFQADGSMGAWDAQPYFAENSKIYLPGHASAGFKSHVDSGVETYEDAADVKRFAMSRAGFVKPEYRRMVKERLAGHANRCREMGLSPQNTADCYWLLERLPNWQGYLIGQNEYFFHQIQILDNQNLLRVSYAGGWRIAKISGCIMKFTEMRIPGWLRRPLR